MKKVQTSCLESMPLYFSHHIMSEKNWKKRQGIANYSIKKPKYGKTVIFVLLLILNLHGISRITNCKNKILLFHALEYVDCIDWEKDAIHDPPYTRNMSDEELKAFSLQTLTLNIPSNTVLTERSIRDMDNLSLAITSQEKQYIMIIALEESYKNKIKKK